jgi:signal transduction histidine kinase/CheY-like chemotaxis protein
VAKVDPGSEQAASGKPATERSPSAGRPDAPVVRPDGAEGARTAAAVAPAESPGSADGAAGPVRRSPARIERWLVPSLLVLLVAPLVVNAATQSSAHPLVDLALVTLGLLCLAVLWLRIRAGDRRAADERERAEADRDRLSLALGRERATLASVIASMSEGLAILDADQIVRYANRPAGLLLGLEPGASLGFHVEQLIARLASRLESPGEALGDWRRISASPEARGAFEVRFKSPVPRDVRVQVFTVPTDDDARAGIGITLRDVTHERDMNRVKDEIISVVNHELRTPLASVVGFAELLLSRELPEEQRRRFLVSIAQEGLRLAALVDELLDLQRLDGGGEPFTFEACSPHALLERSAATAGPDPDRPIVIEAAPDLPPVRADADRVQQVLSNLLGNARKYSPNGGTIVMSARALEGSVEISVTDQGLGIPPEALPRLFEKLYRVDSPDRREIRGSGLGLAIVKQIVEVHGGRVRAESAGLGQGARVSLTLPIADVPAEAGDVLIVEDDLIFGRLLEVELASRGLTARRVETGAAALAAVLGTPPRALMLDLMLPDTTGGDLLRDLQARGLAVGTVVIITHRDLLTVERDELEALGTTRVLLKRPGVAGVAADAIAASLGGGPIEPHVASPVEPTDGRLGTAPEVGPVDQPAQHQRPIT